MDIYKQNRDKILLLLKKSLDIAENYWDIRLHIQNRQKTFTAKDIQIENDIEKYSKYALKYLDPNYTYDA